MELLIAFLGGIAAAYFFAWCLCRAAADGDRALDRECDIESALRQEERP